ncbi:hypothetical protein CCACVL1_01508 [Corchorus capsularis]|uniref:Bifunctional inhibitor/plant lipid transfer protein/seed storage helical domain-containing protein n=1 Tax=Corchorus capsularis TaxID=210143 RepID=A0A1R3KHU6_COCAP|nr:hypothetical protein CCACVL1_01508 [Corchorus capsularis]
MAALHSLSPIAFSCIVMVLLFLPTALSQDPFSPGPTIADCTPRLMALMPCAPFVQGAASIPTQSCCDNLNQLYSIQSGCLCLLLNESTLSAFPINRNLALQLPFLCKLPANLTASCSGVPSPAGPSGSQVSLGAKQNSSVASSPMLAPTVPVAPRPSIMGLGFGKSNAGRLKTQNLFPMVTSAAILLSGQALL